MSLEKAIQENTEAVKALTAALQAGGVAAPVETKAEEKPKAEKKKAAPKKEAKAEAPKEEPKADAKPDYESDKYVKEVKPLTLKVIKTISREAVANVLAEFGDDLKSAKDLSADQYDDYMAKLNALLEEDLA